jgi:hypothetical protein
MTFIAVCTSLFYGAVIWAIYLAFEPQVRRRWPQTLIAWSAVLAGKFREPIVGRDVLYGIAMALSWQVIGTGIHFAFGLKDTQPEWSSSNLLLGSRAALGAWLLHIPGAIRETMMFFFLFFVFRTLFKREWLASSVFILLFTVISASQSKQPLMDGAIALLIFGTVALVVFRVGVLALAIGLFVVGVVDGVPVTFNGTDWYFSNAAFTYLSVAALAIAAFRITTANQLIARRHVFD